MRLSNYSRAGKKKAEAEEGSGSTGQLSSAGTQTEQEAAAAAAAVVLNTLYKQVEESWNNKCHMVCSWNMQAEGCTPKTLHG